MINKAAPKFEEIFCSFNQLVKGLVLSGETMSKHEHKLHLRQNGPEGKKDPQVSLQPQ